MSAARDARILPAASDGDHAWFVVDRARAAGIEHVLLHHAEGMGPAGVREAYVLAARPEAIATAGGRAWVVLPAESGGMRSVCSVQAERNPATGAWYSVPTERLDRHPPLPADGALRGVCAADGRLFALRDGATVEELATSGWMPSAGAPAGASALVSVEGHAAVVGADGAVTVRDAGGSWRPSGIRLPADGVVAVVSGARVPMAVVRGPDGSFALRAFDGAEVLPAASFEAPSRPWAVVGLGDGCALVVPTGEGGAAIRRIDLRAGTVGPSTLLVPQPADASAWVGGAAVAFIASAVLAWAAIRHARRLKSRHAERR